MIGAMEYLEEQAAGLGIAGRPGRDVLDRGDAVYGNGEEPLVREKSPGTRTFGNGNPQELAPQSVVRPR